MPSSARTVTVRVRGKPRLTVKNLRSAVTVRTGSGMAAFRRRGAKPAPHLMRWRIGKWHEVRVARADFLAQRTARRETASRGHRADGWNLAGNGAQAAGILV